VASGPPVLEASQTATRNRTAAGTGETLFVPAGRRPVATGGAQRNPWNDVVLISPPPRGAEEQRVALFSACYWLGPPLQCFLRTSPQKGRATLAPGESSNPGYASSSTPTPRRGKRTPSLHNSRSHHEADSSPPHREAVELSSRGSRRQPHPRTTRPLPTRTAQRCRWLWHAVTMAGGRPDSGATTRPLSSVGAWCLLFVRFHRPTSRARTNTVIVPTPKHEFPHFSAQFHPLPRPPIATSARRLPLSTHQHPPLCARP